MRANNDLNVLLSKTVVPRSCFSHVKLKFQHCTDRCLNDGHVARYKARVGRVAIVTKQYDNLLITSARTTYI